MVFVSVWMLLLLLLPKILSSKREAVHLFQAVHLNCLCAAGMAVVLIKLLVLQHKLVLVVQDVRMVVVVKAVLPILDVIKLFHTCVLIQSIDALRNQANVR